MDHYENLTDLLMPFTVNFLTKNNKEYHLEPRISEDLFITAWFIHHNLENTE